jgi:cobalt-zinc-cadmium efflux system membrane fusion protein
MIPIDAVQTIESEQVVFVPGNEDGSYKPVEVMLGSENEGYVEIASGLKPGQQAVIAGAFDLKSALTAQGRSASHGH